MPRSCKLVSCGHYPRLLLAVDSTVAIFMDKEVLCMLYLVVTMLFTTLVMHTESVNLGHEKCVLKEVVQGVCFVRSTG